MKKINLSSEKSMTKRQKLMRALTIAGTTAFGIVLAIVVIGLIVGPGKDDASTTPEKPEQKDETTEIAQTPDKESGFGLPKAEFNDAGIIPMVKTDDPRVAAAAIARTMMSVDSSKVTDADDFRLAVLDEVMHPTAGYVGLGDQWIVHDTYPRQQDRSIGAETVESYNRFYRELKNYSPTGEIWWRLAISSEFRNLQGAKLESEPVVVMDRDEMLEYEGEEKHWLDLAGEIQLKDGATLSSYWVQVDMRASGNGYDDDSHGSQALRYPVSLAIYCDPPEESGVCGLAAPTGSFPKSWQLQ